MSSIHVETPLQRSAPLSDLIDHEVFLKLENIQPSGSFKLRGMGYHSQKEVERGCKHLISASGGNAGVAVTLAGKLLDVPVTVFVPSSTPKLVHDRIMQFSGHVKVHGENFGQANDRAVEESKKPGCSYIHPYLHPETWEGHSTMIDEMAKQLEGRRPGCLVVSVGGGGLLRGLLVGMERHGWHKIPVLALETHGADCMDQAVKAGKIVELPSITSIAVTLGAKSVFPNLLEVLPNFNVHNRVVSDAQALEACLRFADDHRILVEPACGAALAGVYLDLVRELPGPLEGPVVVVVCGGAGVSFKLLADWARKLNVPVPWDTVEAH